MKIIRRTRNDIDERLTVISWFPRNRCRSIQFPAIDLAHATSLRAANAKDQGAIEICRDATAQQPRPDDLPTVQDSFGCPPQCVVMMTTGIAAARSRTQVRIIASAIPVFSHGQDFQSAIFEIPMKSVQ